MSKTRKIALPGTTYTNPIPMPEKVGGYNAGTTFDNVDFKDLIDGLLYPYQYPSFSSFYISGQSTVLECGEAISGDKTFIWNILNSQNVQSNSITIEDVTNALVLASGLVDDGSEVITLSSVTKTTTAQNNTWKISAQNTKSQTFSRNYTVTWYDPFFYGVGTPGLSVANIQQLSKSVSAKGNKTFSFSPNNQVYYFAYPAIYGQLISILDTNGFEIINDFILRTETFTQNGTYFKNIVDVTYYVYEFNNLTTQINFNITFKF